MKDLKQLKQNELKEIREKILEEQGYKCAICGKELSKEECVLDHQHKIRKSDPNGENGNGLVRGVLCKEDNLAEGKIFNALVRYLQIKTDSERIQFLEKLIEYYRQPKYPLIHPTEVPKEPDVSKKNFNKLKKLYEQSGGKKDLEYPKSKKLTKPLKELFEKYNIPPYN